MPRRGENIYKRKDGRWEGRYIKGHIDGKTQYGYIYSKTYRDVKNKLMDIEKTLKIQSKENFQIKSISDKKILKSVSIEWLESLKPSLKESSIIKYRNILMTYILPHFEEKTIDSISRDDIIKFSNELLLSGGRKGTGLAPKTVISIMFVIKSIFKYASIIGDYDITHISEVTVKQSQKQMRILSMMEQKNLSDYLLSNLSLINLGIIVFLYTGIRIGEICALKWADISFDEQYIFVHQTMQRIQIYEEKEQKTKILISTPKSNCSIRKIPIPNVIFEFIVSAKCKSNTYFLTGYKDVYVEPRTMQNHFKTVIKNSGIEKANFHSLRHTFSTRCIELGFDVKSLSEILGHTSVNITMDRYVHPSMELKQKNMNMFSELFSVK